MKDLGDTHLTSTCQLAQNRSLEMRLGQTYPIVVEHSSNACRRVICIVGITFLFLFFPFSQTGDPCIIYRPRTHHTVHLQPELKFDTENEVSLRPKEYVDEVFEIDGFLDALAELQTNVNAQTKALSIVNDYPKILMLGTGSSIPSKARNTSGILLQVGDNHSILLDCGEGTFGQIVKFYGKSDMGDIMRSIKV